MGPVEHGKLRILNYPLQNGSLFASKSDDILKNHQNTEGETHFLHKIAVWTATELKFSPLNAEYKTKHGRVKRARAKNAE